SSSGEGVGNNGMGERRGRGNAAGGAVVAVDVAVRAPRPPRAGRLREADHHREGARAARNQALLYEHRFRLAEKERIYNRPKAGSTRREKTSHLLFNGLRVPADVADRDEAYLLLRVDDEGRRQHFHFPRGGGRGVAIEQ